MAAAQTPCVVSVCISRLWASAKSLEARALEKITKFASIMTGFLRAFLHALDGASAQLSIECRVFMSPKLNHLRILQ